MLARTLLAVSAMAISAQSVLAVDPFTFAPVTGAPLGTVIYSNRVTLSGSTGFPAPISIVGGEYAIASQSFKSTPDTVISFQTIQVRATSAASPGATKKATLTIGNQTVDFSITTRSPGAGPASALFYVSQPGDSVGLGRTRLINLGPGSVGTTLQVNNPAADRIGILFTEGFGSVVYTLDLEAPGNAPLVQGSYEGALRWPFNGNATGLSFGGGEGSGCNELTGRFDVLDVAINGGNVERLAVNFEQHCVDGFGTHPALFGQMRVNSALPFSGGAAWAPADLNGDGRSDIVWRHALTGENYVFSMNGLSIVNEGYLRTVEDADWHIAGVGDFDGDGKADLFWRNTGTGETYLFLMDGLSIKSEGFVRTVDHDDWRIAGAGDFNGDGKADVLWRNTVTGENYAFLMDGLSIVSEGFVRTVADLNWEVAGVGDFDRDGKADILWRNQVSGQNYLFPMDGLAIKPGEGFVRTVADTAWRIACVADLNGDGRADVLWRHATSGENYLFPMDATSILPSEGYVRGVATQWRVRACGDYNGDGKADLLWRNADSGENYFFPMDGKTILAGEGFLRSVPDTDWEPR